MRNRIFACLAGLNMVLSPIAMADEITAEVAVNIVSASDLVSFGAVTNGNLGTVYAGSGVDCRYRVTPTGQVQVAEGSTAFTMVTIPTPKGCFATGAVTPVAVRLNCPGGFIVPMSIQSSTPANADIVLTPYDVKVEGALNSTTAFDPGQGWSVRCQASDTERIVVFPLLLIKSTATEPAGQWTGEFTLSTDF